jgi:hypothetical protein
MIKCRYCGSTSLQEVQYKYCYMNNHVYLRCDDCVAYFYIERRMWHTHLRSQITARKEGA